MYQSNQLAIGQGSLYAQIEVILRGRIFSKAYPPGAPFPTDAKLCEEFSVSRATVRLAIDSLRRDGLVARHPRRGSFVNEGAEKATTLRFNGSIEQIVTQGDGAGTAHVLERRQQVQPSEVEAEELRPQDGCDVARYKGYRMRDGKRIGHMQFAFRSDVADQLALEPGREYPCVFGLLEQRLGARIHRVRQIISAAMPTPAMARALGMKPDVPLLVRQRTFMGANGVPLELAIASYPGDRYRYEIVIS